MQDFNAQVLAAKESLRPRSPVEDEQRRKYEQQQQAGQMLLNLLGYGMDFIRRTPERMKQSVNLTMSMIPPAVKEQNGALARNEEWPSPELDNDFIGTMVNPIGKIPQGSVSALRKQVMAPEMAARGGIRAQKKVNDVFYVKAGNNTNVEVIKNPTSQDYRALSKEFRREYPNAPSGTPKTRSTEDEAGNKYLWSSDFTHAAVEPQISRMAGLKVNQNGFMLPKPKPTDELVDSVARGLWLHGRGTYPATGETFAKSRMKTGNLGEPAGLSLTMDKGLLEKNFAKKEISGNKWADAQPDVKALREKLTDRRSDAKEPAEKLKDIEKRMVSIPTRTGDEYRELLFEQNYWWQKQDEISADINHIRKQYGEEYNKALGK